MKRSLLRTIILLLIVVVSAAFFHRLAKGTMAYNTYQGEDAVIIKKYKNMLHPQFD